MPLAANAGMAIVVSRRAHGEKRVCATQSALTGGYVGQEDLLRKVLYGDGKMVTDNSQGIPMLGSIYYHWHQRMRLTRASLNDSSGTATIRVTHLQIGVGARCMSGLERSICLGINLENNFDEPGPGGKVFSTQRAREFTREFVFFAPSCRTQCLLASP